MSMAAELAALRALGDRTPERALVNTITMSMEEVVDKAATIMGEEHLGADAIAGAGVLVQEAAEKMTEALNSFEFVVKNVCDDVLRALRDQGK